MEQAQRATSLLMRFYNEILDDLRPGGNRYGILIDRLGDRDDAVDFADDWCTGYTLGFALREDEWKEAMEAPELQEAFVPILLLAHPKKSPELYPFEDPAKYAAVLDLLPDCAVEIYEWWRKKLAASMPETARQMSVGTVRRGSPKVSANAPCPCGSGKKYKRCCSSVRAN
jgi:yecA family protein